MKLVECVPNFSEGRDQAVIDAIATAIRGTPGCSLLDVDPGKTTNRTVVTFVGDPEAVVNGAFNAARVAKERIDMRNHKGEHARMGAMDVCPFVPVANVTVAECVECSKQLGKRMGEELGLPVYLYEDAATLDYRRSLKQIRAGEYEALAARIVMPEWKPDFGPAQFIPSYGATVTGSRFFLIAYNVNVLGTKEQATRIAFNVREMGRPALKQPGTLKAVKGCGWFIEEYNLAQVSMNLDNYKITGMHTAYEECRKNGEELHVGVAGSEVVGLVPLEAIIDAAEFYMAKEGLMLLDERQKVRLAIERLGLASVSAFDPCQRIIEYMIPSPPARLASLSLRGFVDSVRARTTAPGGGSVAAVAAALGAGLGTMVGQLTYGKRKYEGVDGIMRNLLPPLYEATAKLVDAVDGDTNAFGDYMAAMALPKGTPEQVAARELAMQAGLQTAIAVPLSVMRLSAACWPHLRAVAASGQLSSWSDVAVGAKCLETGLWGAHKNVVINLTDIKDKEWSAATRAEADGLLADGQAQLEQIMGLINQRVAKGEDA